MNKKTIIAGAVLVLLLSIITATQRPSEAETAQAKAQAEAAEIKAEKIAAERDRLKAVAEASAIAAREAVVASMSEFNQIQDGMSYSDVVKIIGSQGEMMSSNSIGGYKTVMYKWDGSGSFGANMNAMFQNDKLISKAQFGLK